MRSRLGRRNLGGAALRVRLPLALLRLAQPEATEDGQLVDEVQQDNARTKRCGPARFREVSGCGAHCAQPAAHLTPWLAGERHVGHSLLGVVNQLTAQPGRRCGRTGD